MRTLTLSSLIMALAVLGCTSIRTRADIRNEQRNLASAQVASEVTDASAVESEDIAFSENDLDDEPSDTAASDAENAALEKIAADALSKSSAAVEAPEKEAPAAIHGDLNPEVQAWIKYFTVKDRERFQRFLNRGDQYREVVEATLKEHGLPPEFYYLAMIESGYRTDARSHARAVGVWQFISGTAERYGLRVDRFVDERRDPIRATVAAARYLKDLYNVFGSWHLAMSAYNAGEIRVLRAVFKGKSRDFWTLARKGVLPKETANYVPKFLAVIQIGENPAKYGFTIERPSDFPKVVSFEAPGSLTIASMSKVSGVPLATLKRLNPNLLQGRTPAGSGYDVWVPENQVAKFTDSKDRLVAAVDKIPRFRRRGRYPSDDAADSGFHVVRAGDNLAGISARYNISLAYLKRINGLRSNRIYAGQRIRLQATASRRARIIRYRVKRGDNLTELSRRFGISIQLIKKSNRIKRNTLFHGEVLKIEMPH